MSPTTKTISPAAIADAASWFFAAVIFSLILLSAVREDSAVALYEPAGAGLLLKGNQLAVEKPCDEIYVVAEGETLHTISDKCGDPFIVEQNPHIQDPDDVFPGLVIKITPNPRHS